MRVLDATLALATERGLAAVTMRAVAERLNVTPMALYRHVGGKRGLLDGLVERLLLEIRVLDPDQTWRDQLHEMAQSMRVTARRHPDLFLLLFQRAAVTRAATVPRNAVYQALRRAGVPEEKVAVAERLLSTFMLGFAASEAGGRFRGVDSDADLAVAEGVISRVIMECAQAQSLAAPAEAGALGAGGASQTAPRTAEMWPEGDGLLATGEAATGPITSAPAGRDEKF